MRARRRSTGPRRCRRTAKPISASVDGDFDIADARGCPASQQAHFNAAKPSDSPKGPVVNLAEESDYDDVQARLAGIQRLLVIAGYDAYPIDGVPGAKTQAAITKFLNDRKLAADASSGAEFLRRTDRGRA